MKHLLHKSRRRKSLQEPAKKFCLGKATKSPHQHLPGKTVKQKNKVKKEEKTNVLAGSFIYRKVLAPFWKLFILSRPMALQRRNALSSFFFLRDSGFPATLWDPSPVSSKYRSPRRASSLQALYASSVLASSRLYGCQP